MRFLLDTHALLWWLTDDPKLSSRAKEVIADEANTILVSTASAWEVATKFRLGKLEIAADGFEHLPLDYLHALKAAS